MCGCLTLSLEAMVTRTSKRPVETATDTTAITQGNRHEYFSLTKSKNEEGSSETNSERITKGSSKENTPGDQIKSKDERGGVLSHTKAQLPSKGKLVSVEVGSSTRGKAKVGTLRDDPGTKGLPRPPLYQTYSNGQSSSPPGNVHGLLYSDRNKLKVTGDRFGIPPNSPSSHEKKILVARPKPTISTTSKGVSWLKGLFKKTPSTNKQPRLVMPIDIDRIRPGDDPVKRAAVDAKMMEFHDIIAQRGQKGGHV